WEDMQSAHWIGILASFVMGYLAIVSRGMRWLHLLEPLGYKAKSWNSIHAVAFAYFANTFVPRSGELARCAALNQTDDIPVDELFGTVVSERLVDFVMLALFMSIAVISNLDAFIKMSENFQLGEGGFPWPIAIAGVLFVVLFFVLRKKIAQTAFGQKVISFFKGVLNGLKSIRKMKNKGAFIAHTIFIWVMYFFMAYVIYKSVPATQNFTVFECLFIMVAGGLGMIIPAPGGIGSYQFAVKLGFQALGHDGDLGFAIANIIWVVQTGMIVITGGIAYIALLAVRLKKDKLKEESLQQP
ncbi:MAG: flippase-like domain-containing protein, partial [Flavobacteriales bacterium]|nr:flippase-like domain-containing protein [Flavobacteriales bacterium]